jgi:hypothetical protein
MQANNTYNGWTNYATWRVNLEIFDGMDALGAFPYEITEADTYGLSQQLKEYALDLIAVSHGDLECLAESYARAFLSDVNWYEIAESIIENNQSEVDIEADDFRA